MAELVRLRPVEELILKTFTDRFQQVFGCLATLTNTYEKMRVVNQMFAGKQPEYPYAVFIVKGMYQNTESWNTNYMARRGLQAVVHDSNNAAYTVRLMPTSFDLDVEFYTNQFNLGLESSVLSYAKQWLFARRTGSLKFETKYGRVVLQNQVELAPNVQIPTMDNQAESESVYTVKSALTIHGYTSQAELGNIGIVQEVEVEQTIGPAVASQGLRIIGTPETTHWTIPESGS